MPKYRKKPVEIEAFKFEGHGFQQKPKWFEEAIRKGDASMLGGKATIKTLEGIMTASQGDFIIQGVKGEIYPCKPDIFEATYDAV